ncbi:MAG: hypothetical protein CMI71_00915 [Candidatus Pelagibacter sp.]|nr:hypothetical protein [Candidatus Pelagibacter sp.]RPG12080.1 MAG: CDP-alcohol phosphatidyltransferase family protein [Pelagibacteraceae bacterium TMED170]|tara:strand:- start:1143 stop:1946 length:804 start_codon:yes stop_codon:yes gene_type:complete
MFSYQFLRKKQYKDQKKAFKSLGKNQSIDNWSSIPYTCLKARLNLEISVLFIYFIQHLKVTPNFISLIFAFLSILSGIFLASNNNILILSGLIIIFFYGFLDQADGLLARITNQASEAGEILDAWVGHLSTFSFTIGFGIYLYNLNQEKIFIFLILTFLLIKSLDIKNFSFILSYYTLINSKKKLNLKFLNYKKGKNKISKKLIFIKNFFQNFLDNRARSTDFLCLLILINTFFYSISFINYFFYYIIFKNLVLFLGSFYLIIIKKF